MPKVVSTPNGYQTILTEEEHEAIRKAAENKKFRLNHEKRLICRKCGELAFSVEVEHTALVDDDTPEIATWSEAKLRQEVLTHRVGYCLFCDGYPDLIGLPVALLGSFHNKPN
ncbi:MAG TPA: hypothetical protein VD998_03850 [Verrucomicrobiae bacterium]|nr:hypothetical protein [Verrucomicrobiae bacterium]